MSNSHDEMKKRTKYRIKTLFMLSLHELHMHAPSYTTKNKEKSMDTERITTKKEYLYAYTSLDGKICLGRKGKRNDGVSVGSSVHWPGVMGSDYQRGTTCFLLWARENLGKDTTAAIGGEARL